MKQSLNRVTLIGHLGDAPQLGAKDDLDYASFSLATNERWTDSDGEEVERTDWYRVAAFRGLARSLAVLEKGAAVYVEGKLRTSRWEPEDGGPARTSTEVIASRVIFL